MQTRVIKLYKFIIDFLKEQQRLFAGILIIGAIIGYSYFAKNFEWQIFPRFDVEKDCDVGVVTGITGWTYAERELTSEQQDACALRDLDRAKPIVITKEMVGDIPISLIKLYAEGKGISYDDENLTASVQCINNSESHWAETDCLFALESQMQGVVQSLIASIIDLDLRLKLQRHQERLATGFFDGNTELAEYDELDLKYSEYKEPLQNWYASATGKGSLKSTMCDLDGRASWGGTSHVDDVAACFIREEAKQILWLLDIYKDIKGGY